MNDALITRVYIDYILSNPNVSFIEVWADRLYVWHYKGGPKFFSKLSFQFNLPIYYRINDYKRLSKKYHPDLSRSKSPRVLSGDIQTSINDFRQILEIQARGYNPSDYEWSKSQFDRILSIKTASTRSDLTRELSTRLYDRARMVQDRFSINNNSFTGQLQEALETGLRGQGLADIMQELGRENRERCITSEIRRYNMPTSDPDKKKDNYTIYGASPRFEKRRLRRGYGDVFAVFVGGPCDTSPL
jgi:hypothetical protein